MDNTKFAIVAIVVVIWPHRSTTYVYASYCYRPSSVVCRSVGHTSDPCKNGWSERDAVWVEHSSGPKEACIRWCAQCTLAPPGEYHWTVDVRRRCGLLSNYFDHLLTVTSGCWQCAHRLPRGAELLQIHNSSAIIMVALCNRADHNIFIL